MSTDHDSRLVGIGIAVMLVLIGIAAVIFALRLNSPVPSGTRPFRLFGLGWIFVGLFFLFIVFGFGRWLFWPWRYRRWDYWWGPRHFFGDPALEAVRERYARGEITKEQFDQMMRDLEQRRPSGA